MHKGKPVQWVLGVLIGVTTLLIWWQSLQTADRSMVFSDGVSGWLRVVLETLPGGDFLLEHIRKVAHFVEFGVLGVLWSWFARTLPGWHRWLWFAGPLTATVDELLQLTAVGRSAQVSDVLLDTAGYTAGWLLIVAVIGAVRYRQRVKKGGHL